MRGSWGSFLPLTLALFLGLGDSQRDFAGRFDPSSSFRTEAGSRDTTRLRLRNQGSNLGPTGKVYSLFRVHSPPSASEHLPAASPVDHPAWVRSLTGEDNREQPSIPPDHKLPAPQSARGQVSNLKAAADSPDGTPAQRQRMDSSRQRQRNGLKARTVPRAKMQNARGRLMGPNVCGGQCCSGWTTAPGTNRCIKPVCDPPCQNKGSCSRPQLCICRSGFQGAQCEEVVPERVYHPPGSVAALQPPAGSLPKRAGSAEREGSPRGAQTPILQQALAGTQGRIVSPVSQHTGSSRTVRRYPAGNTQLTSNALPNGNGHEQSSSGPHAAYQEHTLSLWGANLTEKIRKIKIVFTPTICKQTCRSGHCYNSCEKGDTTTLYSQGGQNHDPKSGFRIYFCQIPCLNGGRCIGRDECWCPSNSTGKFCHLPVPKLEKKQVGRVPKTLASGSMKQSMYTLPLSNQLASLNPSLVNVHIKHPPEATVQIHQVARVRGDLGQSAENSVEAVLLSQLPTGPQHSYSNGNSNSITTERGQQQRPPELMGRCFRETLHGQCANPLEGLAKFEDCCGSVGLFWGVNRCIPCPPRPAHPVIENRQVECPQGYKRLNRSHCQDINECLMLGLCKDAECVNTRGSFLCTCKPGTMLDPSRSRCVSDKAVSMEQGLCYRSAAGGVCALPLAQSITKQICCCSRVGKGWGKNCEKCPMLGSDIDECADPSTCPRGRCVNALGSYECLSCAAGYQPMNGRCVDDNECFTVGTCAHGLCINLAGSFRCSCYHGYEVTADEKSCQDIDECATHNACPMGLCINAEGSFSCAACGAGYTVSRDGSMCEDIDECSSPTACPLGICTNTDGSFACQACDAGYMLSSDRLTCEDIDECEDPTVSCLGGECLNTPGSYVCHCRPGFELLNGTVCEDMNECLGSEICSPNGECLNSHGSYFCICAPGFSNAAGGVSCQDVDECADKSRCLRGQCFNTEGSYRCLCENGFRHSQETDNCVDVDECADFGDTVCGTWRCQNTLGSYRCIMGCQPGFHRTPLGDCIDIDECANETLCGSHAFCDNTDGSFRCLCDSGYENLPPGQDCVDVNECELMVAVCGTALCENVEGSFLCLCLSDHEEYDTEAGECRPRAGMGDPERPIAPRPAGSERKECYYHISDVQLCDSVLAKNTTKEECCCTEGAAWGDNCETHPCPILGTVEYSEICPSGKGYIPVEGTLLFGQTSYTDADECEMFGPEICRNGHCVNTVPGYKCFCRSGYLYDSSRLECVDQDECENEMSCVNGECLNTAGSFHCFCSLPLVLDVTRNRCINVSNRAEDLDEHEIHLDICWQRVSNYICNQPLRGRRTTYTECCCRYGEAWSQDCALCPHRASEDFAHLCNVARGDTEREAGLQERPGYEYGPALEDSHYGLYSPDLGPYYNYLSPEYGAPDASFPQRELSSEVGGSTFLRTPQLHPAQSQPRYLPSQTGHFDSFEGLQAEECGILNGCENGRCVRVREGYTCDCFDGFQLDMTHMACVDINECEEVSSPGPLCEGGTCENTEGSYRCNCSPGFVVQAEPHRCAPAPAQRPEAPQL
ncbi:latent-transforming growth factor beta-binding protein 2 isoform X6 [Mauremys reevesii]|uniref:latent-transforming growth factor beta-binding protein 2 isoform X6 n=1 Tax=Mauremys reevesii TaxID=260615 RepID=UPI00193F4963|nr:latent-transforming growth factor beta-binding protein 2 isoform X6 [Mauremys reevesii]